jgi:hypothetical protein
MLLAWSNLDSNAIAGSYQNYQNRAVNNHFMALEGDKEFVDVLQRGLRFALYTA